MTDTPEAVRLADQIHAGNGEWMQKAAALLRRIPGLEAEVQEQARLNGMGAERELALMAQVSRLEAERDQLRAELARFVEDNRAQGAGEVVAWCTPDGERCVTARTYEGARKDGGAMWSSMVPFTVPAYTQPATGAVVLDAVRYRMVRRGQHWSVINGIGDTLRGDDLDAAIDAQL